MFSDRQAYANSIDLDHSAPREAVCSGSSLFIIPCTFLDTFLLHEIKTAIVLGVPNFRSLRYKFLLFFMSSFQGILTVCAMEIYAPNHPQICIFFFFFFFFFKWACCQKGDFWDHCGCIILIIFMQSIVLCFIYTVKIVKYCNIYLYHIFEGLMED